MMFLGKKNGKMIVKEEENVDDYTRSKYFCIMFYNMLH